MHSRRLPHGHRNEHPPNSERATVCVAVHVSDEQAAESLLDQFKRLVRAELELLTVEAQTLTPSARPNDNCGKDDKPTKRGGGAVVAAVLVSVFLLPLIYVLALGPLAWIHDRGMMSDLVEDFVEAVYWPLEHLSRESSVVDELIESYVELWES